MAVYIALVKGVNVGGRNRLAMADLRAAVAAIGASAVRTYLQSGNAVFTIDAGEPVALAGALEAALAARSLGCGGVVVLSRERLAAAIADNPFPDESDPTRLHLLFRREPVGPLEQEAIARLVQRSAERGRLDEVVVAGDTLYLHTPTAMASSVLGAGLTSLAALGVTTARNYRTASALLALARD
ncbi:MAG: DUF1697 domain-containing protein [Actinomycetota bacterium]|nr:DUF1697 domain-containing protein [Actinomycetota bacterium]